MSIAVTGAVLIGQWPEAAMVMFLFSVAELIEAKSLDRARNAIRGLMDLTPERATVQQIDGTWLEVDVKTIAVGALVRVRPGERIGLDGEVTSGNSTINQAPITGESLPVEKTIGDPVFAGTINEAGSLEYRVLLVDEYQDCNVVQHAILSALAQVLPTCVLGDPMQAIFGFRGNRLVDWANEVQPQFPAAGELRTPWRWRLAGAENLGQWLLAIRQQLQAGQPVDMRTAPAEVLLVQLNAGTEAQQRLVAARTVAPNAQGTVLIIGDAMNVQGRHQLTSQTPGAAWLTRVPTRSSALLSLCHASRGRRGSQLSDCSHSGSRTQPTSGSADCTTFGRQHVTSQGPRGGCLGDSAS